MPCSFCILFYAAFEGENLCTDKECFLLCFQTAEKNDEWRRNEFFKYSRNEFFRMNLL